MSDITKVREWRDTDETEPEGGWEWPAPPVCIESVVTGELRQRILARAGQAHGRVRIVESEVDGGYSEYTVETYYGRLAVWLDQVGEEPMMIWGVDAEWAAENAMAAFLKWVG